MTAIAIMLVVGLGDLVSDAARARHPIRIALWVVAALAGWLLVGLSPWSLGIALLVAAAWTLLRVRRSSAVVAAIVLVVAVVASLLLDGSVLPNDTSLAVAVQRGALDDLVTPTRLLAVLAATLFVLQSANRLVRIVLEAAKIPVADAVLGTDARTEGWRVRVAGRTVAGVEREERSVSTATLLGGRIVGPLERLLLLAAFLGGVPMVAAGVLAAKGIVRFPEIAADGGGGTKAEEFLVGTFTSLAALVIALLPALTIAP